ncbi:hypothetical protein ACHAPT_002053 [Fusarium lateritium]
MATGVDARLLKSTKFPPEFSQKVDMQKVNLQVMKKWIAGKISDILGNEDDVVIELCFNLIEGPRYPDIKSLQIQLTGFLDKDTASFCKDLWRLLLSAQASPQGVPKELLEAKKLELIQEKTAIAEIERLLVEMPGKDDGVTANLIIGEEEASGGEVGGLDLRDHAFATRETPTVVTVTSHGGDVAVVELDLVGEGPLSDRLQHRAHLDRTRAAVVRLAALEDLTVGDDPHPLEDGEMGERDHDRPEATPIEVEQTVAMMEDGGLLHLALHPQSGVLPHQSEDGTPLRGAGR